MTSITSVNATLSHSWRGKGPSLLIPVRILDLKLQVDGARNLRLQVSLVKCCHATNYPVVVFIHK